MKRLLLLALAFLLPSTAVAQTVNVDRNREQHAPARGITVSARASVSVPATSATITVHVLSSGQNASTTDSQLQSIADALVQAGFDKNDVSKPTSIPMPIASMSSISATTNAPSLDLMKRAISVLTNASLPVSQYSVVAVQLSAKDCGDAMDRARVAAIAKARNKADVVAREINARVGAIQAIDTSQDWTTRSDSGCSSQFTVGSGSASIGFGPDDSKPDPSDYASVLVTSNVTITYAIK